MVISRAFVLIWIVRPVLKNPFRFLLLCMRARMMLTYPFFGNINCQSQIKILLTVSSFVPLGVLCSKIPLSEGRFMHIKPLLLYFLVICLRRIFSQQFHSSLKVSGHPSCYKIFDSSVNISTEFVTHFYSRRNDNKQFILKPHP